MKLKKIYLVRFLIVIVFLTGSLILLGENTNDKKDAVNATGVSHELEQNLGKQVLIEDGEYCIGRDGESDNHPLRTQKFKRFYIDIHPVTNKQYVEFIKKSSYTPKGKFDLDSASAKPLLPAVDITFEDAKAFADFYNKRLPSEWEWEIAARSLKPENVYVSGKSASRKGGHFLNDKEYYNLPVFSYPPNELGIYGMFGNVFEWTSSQYEEKYLLGKYRLVQPVMVLRGGSWTNRPFEIRTTTRTPFPAQRCLGWVGFRCVSDTLQ